jgi:hypothetical protein
MPSTGALRTGGVDLALLFTAVGIVVGRCGFLLMNNIFDDKILLYDTILDTFGLYSGNIFCFVLSQVLVICITMTCFALNRTIDHID